jgi:TPR repeat protein
VGVERDWREAARLYLNVCNGPGDAEAFLKLGLLYADKANPEYNEAHAQTNFRIACQQGSGEGCRRAAERLGEPKEVKRLYEEGCRLKDGVACRRLAELSSRKDVASTYGTLMKQACTYGDATACFQLGKMLGDKREENNDTARFFRKACTHGELQACQRLCGKGEREACVDQALLLAKRGEQSRAKELLNDACAHSILRACLVLGGIEDGHLSIDPGRVKSALKKACALKSAEACRRLGMEAEGAKRSQWLQRACELGSATACLALAEEKEDGERQALLQRACELESPDACLKLGKAYLAQQRYKRAGESLEEACALGSGKGCFERGVMYTDAKGVRRNDAKARRFFLLGCLLDEPHSCSSLGFLYEYGEYRAELSHPDYNRAQYYYRKACTLGDGGGCVLLGTLYEAGKGVEQNLTQADQLYEKACRQGVRYGCLRRSGQKP